MEGFLSRKKQVLTSFVFAAALTTQTASAMPLEGGGFGCSQIGANPPENNFSETPTPCPEVLITTPLRQSLDTSPSPSELIPFALLAFASGVSGLGAIRSFRAAKRLGLNR